MANSKNKTPEKMGKYGDFRDHKNSTRSSDKRLEFIGLIKRDVDLLKSLAHCGIAISTFYDWIGRSKHLSEEYEKAQSYMHVITSNSLASAILDNDVDAVQRAKLSLEWKKKRDDRYIEKREYTLENKQMNLDDLEDE